MNKLILAGFIFLTFACSNKKDTSSAGKPTPTNSERQVENAQSTTSMVEETRPIDILDYDSVWLNDIIPMQSNPDLLIESLGNPDSIVASDYECGAYIPGEEPWGDTVNFWYYDGTQIAVYRGVSEIMKIKLKEWDCTLHHKRFIFSEYTTLEELAAEFPNSVKSAYEVEYKMENQTFTIVPFLPKPIADDMWFFKFQNNKLVEIKYNIPC